MTFPSLAGLSVGCGEMPATFREVSLDDARSLIAAETVAVVDAVEDDAGVTPTLPGGLRWETPASGPNPPHGLPAGPILVVAPSSKLAYRSAATLARSGRRPVYVFITRSKDDRNALVAVARRNTEVPHDADS